jgi:hypothetical protein
MEIMLQFQKGTPLLLYWAGHGDFVGDRPSGVSHQASVSCGHWPHDTRLLQHLLLRECILAMAWVQE